MNTACDDSCLDCPFACHADHENDQTVSPARISPEQLTEWLETLRSGPWAVYSS